MKTIFGLLLWITLYVPLAFLILKLVNYLMENEFQEWWIAIVWVLVLPLSTLTLFFVPKELYEKISKK